MSIPTTTMTTRTGIPTSMLCESTATFGGSLAKSLMMFVTLRHGHISTAFQREVSETTKLGTSLSAHGISKNVKLGPPRRLRQAACYLREIVRETLMEFSGDEFGDG